MPSIPRNAPGDKERRAALLRMRTIATLLPVLMTLIFIATSVTRLDWPWLPYLCAFSRSRHLRRLRRLVCGRRPVPTAAGLPIPHTALVPNNQEKIGAAPGRFMTNNFLSVKATRGRLAQVEVAGWITGCIGNPLNAIRLARSVGLVWAHGEAQAPIDSAITLSESSLTNHKDYIFRKVVEQSSRWIPKWIDKIIADKVMNGLLITLRELRAPEHPWRLELRGAIEHMIEALATDPEMYARGGAFKAELLASPLFTQQARLLLAEVEPRLYSDLRYHAEPIA